MVYMYILLYTINSICKYRAVKKSSRTIKNISRAKQKKLEGYINKSEYIYKKYLLLCPCGYHDYAHLPSV